VPAKIIRYRNYTFHIYEPSRQGTRWYLVIWSPSNAPAITMPGRPTWEEVLKDAQAAVDRILDGGPPAKL
jgi:hypothetical protein